MSRLDDLQAAIANAETLWPTAVSALEEISEKILRVNPLSPWAQETLDALMAERQQVVNAFKDATSVLQKAEWAKDLTPDEERILRRFDKVETRVDAASQQAIGFIRETRAKIPPLKPEVIPSLEPVETLNANDGLKSVLEATPTFVVAGATEKISEAASTVMDTMGSTGPFGKIGANAKSFAEITSAEALGKGLPVNVAALTDLSNLSIVSSDASATAGQINAATGQTNGRTLHKVTLKENGTANVVEFDVLPEIVETHTVEYEAVAPPQFPGAFQKYKGNSATQWQVNAMFISRTMEEATRNYDFLMMLRGWTKPFYGERTANKHKGKLGAPPPVLTLHGLRDLIGPVPVVITSLNWTWQRDVDYIATKHPGPDGKPIPFPTVLSVPLQLVESFSINQFNQFSLDDYRAGKMGPAFNVAPVTEPVKASLDSIGAEIGARREDIIAFEIPSIRGAA